MRKHAAATLLLLFVFWPHTATAQVTPHVEPPPLVRFTGTLLPLEEKERGGIATLTVSVKGVQWLFRIAKIEKLTGRPATELRILESLFPPRLRFTGPAELLGPLQEPGVPGKLLAIEGRFYTGDRMLFVTAVHEVAEGLY